MWRNGPSDDGGDGSADSDLLPLPPSAAHPLTVLRKMK